MSLHFKIVLFFSAVLRLTGALTTELGNDEVYYLTYAQQLQWNYFDHPPMVAMLIRLTTLNLNLTDEFFIRLGPLLLSTVNTILLYRLVGSIKNEKAAFISSLLFVASPYCAIITGVFILPDSAQLFFWIASISVLTRVILHKTNRIGLLLFGLTSGLCIMSKVHGVFLWFGFALYAVCYDRSLLRSRYCWLGAVITLIVASPILFWNIQNDFITYNFHAGRVSITTGLHADSFLKELAGSILYNNPVNVIIIIAAIISIIKKKPVVVNSLQRLYLLLGLPLIILLLAVSLFRDTLPHWSGPGYISLIMLAGCYVADLEKATPRKFNKFKRLAIGSFALLAFIVVSAILLINFYPGTLGSKSPGKLGEGDFTLDMYGWKQINRDFESLRSQRKANELSNPSFFVSDKWFPGSHIDNYIAQPLGMNFLAIGSLIDIHTYAWLNKSRKKIRQGEDAYFMAVSNYPADPVEKYKDFFTSIEKIADIPQLRGALEARRVSIYLLRDYKAGH